MEITLRVTVGPDRIITLPPEVPEGEVEIHINIDSAEKKAATEDPEDETARRRARLLAAGVLVDTSTWVSELADDVEFAGIEPMTDEEFDAWLDTQPESLVDSSVEISEMRGDY